MKSILLILFVLLAFNNLYAEDHYYYITTRQVYDGKNERFYVKSPLSLVELGKSIEDNRIIVFPQTYAYILASDKFDIVSGWNDMLTGEMAIRGENIMCIQVIVSDPVLFKSKNRVFSSGDHENEKSKIE